MNSPEDYGKYFGKDYYEIVGEYKVNGHVSMAQSLNGHYKWEDEVVQRSCRVRYIWIQNHVLKNKKTWKKILDVGCGKGFMVKYLRDRGHDVWGIDLSKYAIDNCHSDVKDYVFRGDICNTKRFKKNEFDMVMSWGVLALVDHTKLEKAIKKISWLAKNYLILKLMVEGSRIAKKIEPDCYDGSPIYLKPSHYWIQLIEKFNKFRLREFKCIGPVLDEVWSAFWRVEVK